MQAVLYRPRPTARWCVQDAGCSAPRDRDASTLAVRRKHRLAPPCTGTLVMSDDSVEDEGAGETLVRVGPDGGARRPDPKSPAPPADPSTGTVEPDGTEHQAREARERVAALRRGEVREQERLMAALEDDQTADAPARQVDRRERARPRDLPAGRGRDNHRLG